MPQQTSNIFARYGGRGVQPPSVSQPPASVGSSADDLFARYGGRLVPGRDKPTVLPAPVRVLTSEPIPDEPPAVERPVSSFDTWYADKAARYNLPPNPDEPSQFYDYRAAFAAGAEPDETDHWPSEFKKPGHPNEVVGGFNTRTGERVPGTRIASSRELQQLGWAPDEAAAMSPVLSHATTQPPTVWTPVEQALSALATRTPKTVPFNPPRFVGLENIRPVASHAPTAQPLSEPIPPFLARSPGPLSSLARVGPSMRPATTLERVRDVAGSMVDTARQFPPVVAAEAAYNALWGDPKQGLAQIGQGVAGAATAKTDPKQWATALSDLAEGSMRVGAPLVLPALAAAPFTTAVMMSLATVASEEAGALAKRNGLSEEYQRLAQNAAALAVLGVGSRRILKGQTAIERKAVDVGRSVGKFFRKKAPDTAIEPPTLDVEPVAGGRGQNRPGTPLVTDGVGPRPEPPVPAAPLSDLARHGAPPPETAPAGRYVSPLGAQMASARAEVEARTAQSPDERFAWIQQSLERPAGSGMVPLSALARPPSSPEAPAAPESAPEPAPAPPTPAGGIVEPEPGGPAEPARQPWQMTYRELRYDVLSPGTREGLQRARPILAVLFPEMTAEHDPWGIYRAIVRGDEIPRVPAVDLSQKHRRSIVAALAAGESVPSEVLADYPDLAPKSASLARAGSQVPQQEITAEGLNVLSELELRAAQDQARLKAYGPPGSSQGGDHEAYAEFWRLSEELNTRFPRRDPEISLDLISRAKDLSSLSNYNLQVALEQVEASGQGPRTNLFQKIRAEQNRRTREVPNAVQETAQRSVSEPIREDVDAETGIGLLRDGRVQAGAEAGAQGQGEEVVLSGEQLVTALRAKGFDGTIDRLQHGQITEAEALGELQGTTKPSIPETLVSVDPYEIASEMKGEGVKRDWSWSRWIQHTSLNPGMDAKDWYRIWDSVSPAPPSQPASAPAQPAAVAPPVAASAPPEPVSKQPWYESLAPDARERVFVEMRRLNEQAMAARERERQLTAPHGSIEVGAGRVDETIRATALEGFLFGMNRGMTPQEAAQAAQSDVAESVKKWNAHRGRDWQTHRSPEHDSPIINDAMRAVWNAGTSVAGFVPHRFAPPTTQQAAVGEGRAASDVSAMSDSELRASARRVPLGKRSGHSVWEEVEKRGGIQTVERNIASSTPSSDPVQESLSDWDGFIGGKMTPLQQGKARAALSGYLYTNGKSVRRGDLVKAGVEAGHTVETREGQPALVGTMGAYRLESQLGKTAIAYAQHLIDAGQTKPGESVPLDVTPPRFRPPSSRRKKAALVAAKPVNLSGAEKSEIAKRMAAEDEAHDALVEKRRAVAPQFVEDGLYYRDTYVNPDQWEGSRYNTVKSRENPDQDISTHGRTFYDTIVKAEAWLAEHPEFSEPAPLTVVESAPLPEAEPVTPTKPREKMASAYLNEDVEYGGETMTRGERRRQLLAGGATERDADAFETGAEQRARRQTPEDARPATPRPRVLTVEQADALEGTRYAIDDAIGVRREGDPVRPWATGLMEAPLVALGSPDPAVWRRFAADATPQQMEAVYRLVDDATEHVLEGGDKFNDDPRDALATLSARLRRLAGEQAGQGDLYDTPQAPPPVRPDTRQPLDLPDRPTALTPNPTVTELDAYQDRVQAYEDALRKLGSDAEQRPYQMSDAWSTKQQEEKDWAEERLGGLERDRASAIDREVGTDTQDRATALFDLGKDYNADELGKVLGIHADSAAQILDMLRDNDTVESFTNASQQMRHRRASRITPSEPPSLAGLVARKEADVRDGTLGTEPKAQKAEPSQTLLQAVEALPALAPRGPKPGTPEFQAALDRDQALSDQYAAESTKLEEIRKKQANAGYGTKVREKLDEQYAKQSDKTSALYNEVEKARAEGYDLRLQHAYNDPATPPEQKLAIADKIQSHRKETRSGRPSAYAVIKAEATRRLVEWGATDAEAKDWGSSAAGAITDSPLWEGARLEKQLKAAQIRIPEQRAERGHQTKFDALVAKYNPSGSSSDRRKLDNQPAATRERYLAEFETKFSAEKDARDYAEKQKGEASAARLAEEMTQAQTWADEGNLVWVWVGRKDKGGRWRPTQGKPVTLPNAPPGYTFSLSKPLEGTGWMVTEDSTGMGSNAEKTQALAINAFDEKIKSQGPEKFKAMLEKVLEEYVDLDSKPSLRNVLKGKGARFSPPISPEAQARKAKPLNMAGQTRPERQARQAAPAFSALHPSSQEKFNAAWDAHDAGSMQALLHPRNRGLRAEWEQRTRTTLPKTVGATQTAVAEFFVSKKAPATDTREPWQLTLEDYETAFNRGEFDPFIPYRDAQLVTPQTRGSGQYLQVKHEKDVLAAIERGDAVPDEVRAEYQSKIDEREAIKKSRALGGPGSGWTAENGHVPGSQGGTVRDVKITSELLAQAVKDSAASTHLPQIANDAQGVVVGSARILDREINSGRTSIAAVSKEWAATRAMLRTEHGDTLRLWRVDAPVHQQSKDTVTVYMGDKKLADKFGDAKPYEVKTDDVVALYAPGNGYYEFIVRKPATGGTSGRGQTGRGGGHTDGRPTAPLR